jgi:hypothetical protein
MPEVAEAMVKQWLAPGLGDSLVLRPIRSSRRMTRRAISSVSGSRRQAVPSSLLDVVLKVSADDDFSLTIV